MESKFWRFASRNKASRWRIGSSYRGKEKIKLSSCSSLKYLQAFEQNGELFIASASTGENEAISIYIWTKKQRLSVSKSTLTSIYNKHLRGPIHQLLQIVFWFFIIPFAMFAVLALGAEFARNNVRL